MDNWVDPIKDQVAWDFGYVNFEGFKKALREGNETAWIEFDIITSKIAREYGKDVEKEYKKESYIEGYGDAEDDMSNKIESLEDEISDLESDLRREVVYTEYLEDLLERNEIEYEKAT